ncbi:MAG: glycosyltransferase [Phycisphaerales bacterium]|jgi:glycosyltransferase involved in cell wall biosynthesis
MRICLTSSEVAPFHGWGVGTCTTNYLFALRDAGHDVHVLADDLPGLRAQGANALPGITVHVLAGEGLHHVPCIHTRRPLAIYRWLRDLHATYHFDALLFNDFYADAFHVLRARQTTGAFAGVAIGILLHSPITLLRRINRQTECDLEVAAITHMERACFFQADLLIAPSQAIVRELAAIPELQGSVPGLDSHRVKVIPYAFSEASAAGHEHGSESRATQLPGTSALRADSKFPGTSALRADSKFPGTSALRADSQTSPAGPPAGGSGSPGTQNQILFFGRLERRKGVETLITAASTLMPAHPGLTVRIVGVDTDTAPGRRSMRGWLTKQIPPALRDRVTFEGNQPRDAIAAMVREAAVVCIPSFWENYPNACLEAMSEGALVVGSNSGGMAEIITDGVDGLLFRAGDSADLARVLARALTDPVATDMRAAAPATIARLCNPQSRASELAAALEAARASLPYLVAQASGLSPSSPSSNHADRVTVIVPCYNLGHTLPATLNSLWAQTRLPDEVIVIDDGSTDPATRDLLDHLSHERLTIIRQHNQGLPRARNAGIAAASGTWIIPLDADDMLAPTFIQAALHAATHNPGLGVITSHMACFHDSPADPALEYVPLGDDTEILRVVNCLSSATAMVRRDLLLAAGGYDPDMVAYEDWDLWCTLLARGVRFGIIPEALILNRMRPDSMLRSMPLMEQQALRARLIQKHAGLPGDPTRSLRIMLGESCHFQRLWQESGHGQHPEPPMRHRLADQASEWLHNLGLAPAIKAVVRTMT